MKASLLLMSLIITCLYITPLQAQDGPEVIINPYVDLYEDDSYVYDDNNDEEEKVEASAKEEAEKEPQSVVVVRSLASEEDGEDEKESSQSSSSSNTYKDKKAKKYKSHKSSKSRGHLGPRPVAKLRIQDKHGSSPFTTILTADKSIALNGNIIVKYIWDFGDGSPVLETTTPIVSHVFYAPLSEAEKKKKRWLHNKRFKNFYPKLRVVDSEGAVSHPDKKLVKVKKTDIPLADPPTAALALSSTSIKEKSSVTIDASGSVPGDNPITSYTFSFSNGDPSVTQTTPVLTKTFNSAGTITITATVTDSLNLSDSASATLTVQPLTPPTASLVLSKTNPKQFETITLDASGSTAGDGAIVSYTFSFSNGDASVTQSTPVLNKSFSNPGIVQVSVTVADSNGKSSNANNQLEVLALTPPTASLVLSKANPKQFEEITLDASASTAGDGSIVSYTFSFDNGDASVTQSSPTLIKSFSTIGNVLVSVEVKDSFGLTNVANNQLEVLALTPPTASLSLSKTTAKQGEKVVLDGSASTAGDGAIVSYEFSFSNGEASISGANSSVEKAFGTIGNVSVTLKVTDSFGLTSSTTQSLTIEEASTPKALFSFLGDITDDGTAFELQIFFAGEAGTNPLASGKYTLSNGQVKNVFDFVKGAQTNFVVPAGTYTLTLELTDSIGLTNTYTRSISTDFYTNPPDIDVIPIVAGNNSVFLDMSRTYDPAPQDDGGTEAGKTVVDWGDGTSDTYDGDLEEFSYFPQHTYASAGTYNISVSYTSFNSGLSDSTSLTVDVISDPVSGLVPIANFRVIEPDFAEHVRFIVDYSASPNGEIISYAWDFGDGTTGTGPEVAHFYSAGVYEVKLTVTDFSGASSTSSQRVVIFQDGPPVISWAECFESGIDGHLGCEAIALDKFSDLKSVTAIWGDGTETTLPVDDSAYSFVLFNHNWQYPDFYDITFIAETNRGETGEFTLNVRVPGVINQAPIASIFCNITGRDAVCDSSNSFDPDGFVSHYNWYVDGVDANFHASLFGISLDLGEHVISVAAVDNLGREGEKASQTVIIANATPIAQINCFSNQIREARCNAFGSNDPDGVIVNYLYTFEGGITQSVGFSGDILQTLSRGGNHTVNLTVTDNFGGTASSSTTVNIQENQAPTFDLLASRTLAEPPATITYTIANPNDLDGHSLTFLWFENGVQVGSGLTYSRDYDTAGIYSVEARVGDGYDTISKTISVTINAPPTPSLSASATSVSPSGSVSFNSSSSTDGDGQIVKTTWIMPDGTRIEGELADFVFNYAGTYSVTMIIEDDSGNESSESVTITVPETDFYIANAPPREAFVGEEWKYTYQLGGIGAQSPDGIVEIVSAPVGLVHDSVAHTMTWTPIVAGEEELRIRVRYGDSVDYEVVERVNAILLDTILDLTIEAGQTILTEVDSSNDLLNGISLSLKNDSVGQVSFRLKSYSKDSGEIMLVIDDSEYGGNQYELNFSGLSDTNRVSKVIEFPSDTGDFHRFVGGSVGGAFSSARKMPIINNKYPKTNDCENTFGVSLTKIALNRDKGLAAVSLNKFNQNSPGYIFVVRDISKSLNLNESNLEWDVDEDDVDRIISRNINLIKQGVLSNVIFVKDEFASELGISGVYGYYSRITNNALISHEEILKAAEEKIAVTDEALSVSIVAMVLAHENHHGIQTSVLGCSKATAYQKGANWLLEGLADYKIFNNETQMLFLANDYSKGSYETVKKQFFDSRSPYRESFLDDLFNLSSLYEKSIFFEALGWESGNRFYEILDSDGNTLNETEIFNISTEEGILNNNEYVNSVHKLNMGIELGATSITRKMKEINSSWKQSASVISGKQSDGSGSMDLYEVYPYIESVPSMPDENTDESIVFLFTGEGINDTNSIKTAYSTCLWQGEGSGFDPDGDGFCFPPSNVVQTDIKGGPGRELASDEYAVRIDANNAGPVTDLYGIFTFVNVDLNSSSPKTINTQKITMFDFQATGSVDTGGSGSGGSNGEPLVITPIASKDSPISNGADNYAPKSEPISAKIIISGDEYRLSKATCTVDGLEENCGTGELIQNIGVIGPEGANGLLSVAIDDAFLFGETKTIDYSVKPFCSAGAEASLNTLEYCCANSSDFNYENGVCTCKHDSAVSGNLEELVRVVDGQTGQGTINCLDKCYPGTVRDPSTLTCECTDINANKYDGNRDGQFSSQAHDKCFDPSTCLSENNQEFLNLWDPVKEEAHIGCHNLCPANTEREATTPRCNCVDGYYSEATALGSVGPCYQPCSIGGAHVKPVITSSVNPWVWCRMTILSGNEHSDQLSVKYETVVKTGPYTFDLPTFNPKAPVFATLTREPEWQGRKQRIFLGIVPKESNPENVCPGLLSTTFDATVGVIVNLKDDEDPLNYCKEIVHVGNDINGDGEVNGADTEVLNSSVIGWFKL